VRQNGFCPRAGGDVAWLYVHALTDAPVPRWTAHGRAIQSVAVGNIFAVGERRAEPPQLSENELRFQHAVVVRVASRVPAVLPARFGSLIDDEALASIIRQRQLIVDEAMTRVRGRIQMTLRTSTANRTNSTTTAAARGSRPVSGKQYLERRRKEASTRLSPRLESLIAGTTEYVDAELRQATPAGSVVLYHLLKRRHVKAYRTVFESARGVRVSGPWPPFAFVPELWS